MKNTGIGFHKLDPHPETKLTPPARKRRVAKTGPAALPKGGALRKVE
jgi:hypothetical protein